MIILFKSLISVRQHTRKNGSLVKEHVRQAAKFAQAKHKGQTRADGKTPYIVHPLTVATILGREAGIDDETAIIAALLHDTIEDTGATHKELADLFGKDVADTVLEVTNDSALPKPSQKQAQIDHGKTRSPRGNMVKMADKIANLRDILNNPPPWSSARKREYFDHARQVVDAMPDRNGRLLDLFGKIYDRRSEVL